MTLTLVPKPASASAYSADMAAAICAEIACGRSMREVCGDAGMPSMRTVFYWLSHQNEFQRIYALAVAARTDALAEELISIADDGSHDWVERQRKDGTVERVVDNEAVQRSRLRVDTRKWLLSKLRPMKYGDQVAITGAGGKDLIPEPRPVDETALKTAIVAVLKEAAAP